MAFSLLYIATWRPWSWRFKDPSLWRGIFLKRLSFVVSQRALWHNSKCPGTGMCCWGVRWPSCFTPRQQACLRRYAQHSWSPQKHFTCVTWCWEGSSEQLFLPNVVIETWPFQNECNQGSIWLESFEVLTHHTFIRTRGWSPWFSAWEFMINPPSPTPPYAILEQEEHKLWIMCIHPCEHLWFCVWSRGQGNRPHPGKAGFPSPILPPRLGPRRQ